MTVILVHASDRYAFLAADSARWDYIERRNIGPVPKIHQTRSGVWFASGGSGIDRTDLSRIIARSSLEGDLLLDKSTSKAARLFEVNKALAAQRGVAIPHFLVSWYAMAKDEVDVVCHRLPDDTRRQVIGLDFMGPDTRWLATVADRQLQVLGRNGSLPLDRWAIEVIAAASERHPEQVSSPISYVLLRRNGTPHFRANVHAATWDGPEPCFEIASSLLTAEVH